MKKIISSLLISLSIASCAYSPTVSPVLDNGKRDSYTFDIGQKKNGATISAFIDLGLNKKFGTKAIVNNVSGSAAKQGSDISTVSVYLLALASSYAGTDPLTDTVAITNNTNPLMFTFTPSKSSFGVKFTNIGTVPANTEYYVGVVAKDAGGNVITTDTYKTGTPVTWGGSTANMGFALSSTSVGVDSNLALVATSTLSVPTTPLSVSLVLKSAVGAQLSSNITVNDGLTQSYSSDMLGLSTIAGGTVGGITPDLINGQAGTKLNLSGTGTNIAVDNAGVTYVSDSGSNTVFYVDKSGIATVVATGLNVPQGIAVNGNGDIFVVEQGSNTVTKFTKQSLGSYTKASYTNNNATLLQGIATTTNGNKVYLTDAGANLIGVLDTTTSTGVFSVLVTLTKPAYSLTTDKNDNVVFTYADGSPTLGSYANSVLTANMYTSPTATDSYTDVKMDYTRNLYVINTSATSGKGSLLKFDFSTLTPVVMAGLGVNTTNTTGLPGGYASLNPEFVAVDPGKNLSGDPAVYFVDNTGATGSNLIVKKLVP